MSTVLLLLRFCHKSRTTTYRIIAPLRQVQARIHDDYGTPSRLTPNYVGRLSRNRSQAVY